MFNHAASPAGVSRCSGTLIAVALSGVSAVVLAGASCPITGSLCPTCTDADGVYLEGDPAPGTLDGFQTFDRPNLSETGIIAFAGDTDGDTASDDVVYVGDTLIARQNDPAPGVPGGAYSSFEFFETSHQVNATGGIAYIATLTDVPTTANRAVYKTDSLVAREGDPADGIPGRLYVDFGFAGLTDAGAVGFLADLDGTTSDDSVIYLGGVVLYREGDAVPALPGIPPGTTWDGNFDEIQWNGAGDLLFEGNTSLKGEMDWVLFRRLADGSELIVAQEGQPVDANGGPDFLQLILQSALAENGDWGMRGNLGVAPSDSDAIIITGSNFQRQEGEEVDELANVMLGNFNGIDVNSSGDVLYLADLEGAPPPGVDEGLFLNCCLLVTTGQQVPELPKGTTFSDIGFEDMYITDDGQIVFAANYTGTVVGDGLFVIDCAEACTADTNNDGLVNVDDLVNVILDWGTDGSANNGDVNDDGIVDVDDLVAVITQWGVC